MPYDRSRQLEAGVEHLQRTCASGRTQRTSRTAEATALKTNAVWIPHRLWDALLLCATDVAVGVIDDVAAVAVLLWSLMTVGAALGSVPGTLDVAVGSPPGDTLASDPVEREDTGSSSNTCIIGRPNCGTAETMTHQDEWDDREKKNGWDLPEVTDKKMHDRAVTWRNVPAVTWVGRKRIIFITAFAGMNARCAWQKRKKRRGPARWRVIAMEKRAD